MPCERRCQALAMSRHCQSTLLEARLLIQFVAGAGSDLFAKAVASIRISGFMPFLNGVAAGRE